MGQPVRLQPVASGVGGFRPRQLPELHAPGRHLRAKAGDRKSTRLNSSHGYISYAVFCLKKKKKEAETLGASRKRDQPQLCPAATPDSSAATVVDSECTPWELARQSLSVVVD